MGESIQMSHHVSIGGVLVVTTYRGRQIPQAVVDDCWDLAKSMGAFTAAHVASRLRRHCPDAGLNDREALARKIVSAFKKAGRARHLKGGLWQVS